MKAVRCSSRLFRFSFAGRRRRFVALVVLCLWLILSLGSVAQETKPTLQEWQINGILAALNDDQKLVRSDAFSRFAQYKPEQKKTFLENDKLAKLLSLEAPKPIVTEPPKLILDNGKSNLENSMTRRDLEAMRRITTELRANITSRLGEESRPYFKSVARYFSRNLPFLFSRMKSLTTVPDYSVNDNSPTVTRADLEAMDRLFMEMLRESDELSKAFSDEIKIVLDDPLLSDHHSILNKILSRDITENISSLKETAEKVKDTSIGLIERCKIAKSIAVSQRLENDEFEYIIDLINESNVANLYNA